MFRVGLSCEHDPGSTAPAGRDSGSPSGGIHAARSQRSVFSLLACPPLGPGNFALLARNDAGEATLLMLGWAPYIAPTLNRGLIRQLGAELGATEVHFWRPLAAVANETE